MSNQSNVDYSESEFLEEAAPPNIRTLGDTEEILDGRNYKLRDIYFQDKQGFVQWTYSITNLKPGMQTRGHRHAKTQELAIVTKGEGFIVLDGVSHRVKVGTYIMIPILVHHKFINLSAVEEMIIEYHHPAHLLRSGYVRKTR